MAFGFFSKERALKKTIERANNVLSQSADRWAAMEKLRDIGTDESLVALCKRFSFTYDKTIEDQQEKDWTVASLVTLGPAALGPLRRHMKNAKHLGYPLKVLGQIADEAMIFEVIDELLSDEEPGYVRDPMRRIDIIEWLGEWSAKPADIVKRVLPYVEDFDENVRIKSVETISRKPDQSAAETVCRAMVREEEESKRFQLRCAEILADNKWPVLSHKTEVAGLLAKLASKYTMQGDTISASS